MYKCGIGYIFMPEGLQLAGQMIRMDDCPQESNGRNLFWVKFYGKLLASLNNTFKGTPETLILFISLC
jgi:hypothetical protein